MASDKAFWRGHAGLVWSNAEADDAIWIRAALLRPRFSRLLDVTARFGLERAEREWQILCADGDVAEVQRARPAVERILANIRKGFALAATEN